MSTNSDNKTKKKKTIREYTLGLNAKTKDFIQSWMFLGPSFLGVSVFFILPFLVVVYYSVIKSPLNPEFVFFENFRNVIGNSAFKIAVKNTLDFSIASSEKSLSSE